MMCLEEDPGHLLGLNDLSMRQNKLIPGRSSGDSIDTIDSPAISYVATVVQTSCSFIVEGGDGAKSHSDSHEEGMVSGLALEERNATDV